MSKRPQIISVDIGSSSIKFSNPDGNNGWHNTVTPTLEKHPFYPDTAYLTPLHILEHIDVLQQHASGAEKIVLTGYKHSLAVGFMNGHLDWLMLRDDPSAVPKGGIPNSWQQILGNNIESKSALNKMATVLEHGVEPLYKNGKELDPTEALYTTGLSLYAAALLGVQEYPVLPADAGDFRLDRLQRYNKTFEEVVGLSSSQIAFGKNNYMKYGDKEVWGFSDIGAEKGVIDYLWQHDIFPANGMVISTDSVAKIFAKGKPYITMRQGGNSVKYLFNSLCARWPKTSLRDMYERYHNVLNGSTMPDTYFYDPFAYNEKGGLWKRERNGKWSVVGKELLDTLSEAEFNEAVKATGWGVASGVASYVSASSEDLYYYGGLLGLGGILRPYWAHVYRECAPAGSRVHWMVMPDAAFAAKLLVFQELGHAVDFREEIPIEFLGEGGGGVERWQEIRDEVTSQSS